MGSRGGQEVWAPVLSAARLRVCVVCQSMVSMGLGQSGNVGGCEGGCPVGKSPDLWCFSGGTVLIAHLPTWCSAKEAALPCPVDIKLSLEQLGLHFFRQRF